MYARRWTLPLLLSAACLPAAATDGYFAMGYGTASKGMGGTGAALSLDTLSVATNPAALSRLGSRFDAGFAWFSPRRSFEVEGTPSGYPGTFPLRPGRTESESTAFLVPSMGLSWDTGGAHSFGLALYGNGGMNTNYKAPVFGAGDTGVNLSQLFLAPTWSWKASGHHAFGASLLLAYQQFEARGLGMFGAMGFSADPANLSDRGKDHTTGLGLRVGYQADLASWASFGASYQSRIRMGKLQRYAGLFAEEGGFDIPASYTVGLALKPAADWTLALDAQRIDYSQVRSIGNPMMPNLMMAKLGQAGGAGFGWKDVTVAKLGVQWQATSRLALRAGYNTCTQPVQDSEVIFNILAPGVVRHHVTLGATQALDARTSLSFSVMRALSAQVSGPNPLEAPGAQRITLRMDQWDAEVGVSVRF